MRIAFYAPFKPLDHPTPSGDRTIARGLVAFLRARGHVVEPVSGLRARWISRRPWMWPKALAERGAALGRAREFRAGLWLTYHTYYKAPDVLGPWCSRRLGLPYAVFQGIYSTKVKKKAGTRLGYELNLKALSGADHVFTNKLRDLENLRRLLPEERLTYAAPGVYVDDFRFSGKSRAALRREWRVGRFPVVMTAAMFRNDVKTQGLVYLIKRLGELAREGMRFRLVVAGDGEMRGGLERLAGERLSGMHRFLGLIPRQDLRFYYSAADVFAFPGINESLGMVYLEAQAAGLPVVAFDNDGVPEVVRNNETGLLTPPFDDKAFRDALAALFKDRERRRTMGERAERRVRELHDLDENYGIVETRLARMTGDGT